MKRRVMSLATALSLVSCWAAMLVWGRSHSRSDAVKFQRVLDAGQPLKVLTIVLYSGAGCVEVTLAKDVLYWPDQLELPGRSLYLSEDRPAHPVSAPINLGWRRRFAGFGVTKDWSNKPPSLTLITLPGVGRLMVAKPVGWTESFRAVWVPYWVFVVMFGVMPGRRVYLWWRGRRRKVRGVCVECGYDLR
ncbi:MAG TPA: hypothetical protein VGQ99_07190, partial [Tepidisphaeraceae bacterium]|nr:hypothetical protein [Tepidisphaeraceae bacterium]